MPDVSRLGVEVTPKGITETKSQLDALTASADKTGESTGGMMEGFRGMQSVMQGPIAAFQVASQVIGAVVAVAKELVEGATEAERGLATLEAVLKSTGYAANLSSGEIQNFAAQLQATTTFEDDIIISAQAILLTFKQIGEEAFPRATIAAADMATVMGMDLQSAITMIGKALNEPIEGVSALRRVGVQLTDEQQVLIASMMEVNDVAGAQNVIMGELESQFGGAAQAVAETATGAMAQYENAISALNDELGLEIARTTEQLTRGKTAYIQWQTEMLAARRLGIEIRDQTGEITNDTITQMEAGLELYKAELDRYSASISIAGYIARQKYDEMVLLMENARRLLRETEFLQDAMQSRTPGAQRPGTGLPNAPAAAGESILTPADQALINRRAAAMRESAEEARYIAALLREKVITQEEATARIISALNKEREALIRLDSEGMISETMENRLIAIRAELELITGAISAADISAANTSATIADRAAESINNSEESIALYQEVVAAAGVLSQELIVANNSETIVERARAQLIRNREILEGNQNLIDMFNGLGEIESEQNIISPETIENLDNLAASLQAIQDVFPAAAREAFLSTFWSLGEALMTGASGGEAMAASLESVVQSMLNQLPQLLLQAGLSAIIAGQVPLGIALIAASGLVSFAGGMLSSASSGTVAASTSSSTPSSGVIPTLPDRPDPSDRSISGRTNVTVNNFANGATATATETTNAAGERQIMVTVENIIKRSIATGRLDNAMTRYAVRPQGGR